MTTMLSDRLRLAVRKAQTENGLPDFLAESLLAIADRPGRCRKRCLPLVEKLVELLPDYDTYAQTGYLGMGVNDADIRVIIRQIESCAEGDENNPDPPSIQGESQV